MPQTAFEQECIEWQAITSSPFARRILSLFGLWHPGAIAGKEGTGADVIVQAEG